ncbi:MAG: DUF29 family protein [Candidatus Kapaibacterium sp.]|nr:MAG: DUF29 family protein [Candidatus Kapabacteria bacterium]
METATKNQQHWQELIFSSHYLTTAAIHRELQDGNVEAALLGTTELMNAMASIDRRAVKSHLIILMMHIIKWKTQENARSRSWTRTIRNARHEISEIREATPSITDSTILAFWDKAFSVALVDAEDEMNCRTTITSLSWHEVFEEEYSLPF